jgi:hypothetical protein
VQASLGRVIPYFSSTPISWRTEDATKFLGQGQSSCQVSEEAKIAKEARLPKKTKGSS